MKFWNTYGSEHSLNLRIIGKFKEPEIAERFDTMIEMVSSFLLLNNDFDVERDRFDDSTREFLMKHNLYYLTPQQVGHLLYDVHLERNNSVIKISSDDDVSAFVSLLIHSGAKVEVFSAHDYPEPKH